MFQRQNGEEEWDGMKSLWFKHDVESGVSVVLETSSVHLFVQPQPGTDLCGQKHGRQSEQERTKVFNTIFYWHIDIFPKVGKKASASDCAVALGGNQVRKTSRSLTMTVSVFFLIMYAVCSEPCHHCNFVWCLFHQNAATAFLKSSASASSFWFFGSELHVEAVAPCLVPAGDRNSPWTKGSWRWIPKSCGSPWHHLFPFPKANFTYIQSSQEICPAAA